MRERQSIKRKEEEDEEDEEVDRVLPGVRHANHFLENWINSSIIGCGLITIHNLLHEACANSENIIIAGNE